ncbi:collagen alpha-4(VI) chain-like [Ylistrum balloti]|uniref:collagen alpha-4(VI) chain-like n=1 Tax=Ylistrum balloti TaxID=509963 RepID=UPI002905B518|nr:collagen alpha-4(VI) chain-like [Ylistrum balloti]
MMWLVVLIAATSLLVNKIDSRPQTTVSTECAPMDVVFLLDSSRNVDFDKQLKFANDVVDQLDVGPGPSQTRVGVISIGYTYLLQFYLRTHTTKEEVKTAISQIRHRYSYQTNTGASIRFLTQYMFRSFFGGRPDATRVAIVITDGQSKDPKSTRYEALLARKKGIKMFAVGVGLANEDELLSIGSQPTDNFVFRVDSYNSLLSVIPNLPKTSCEVSAITKRRPAPTKRFTFPPLIFNEFKFVPPKARNPMTSAPPTQPSRSQTTKLSTLGPFSSDSTTVRPSTQAPTVLVSQSSESTTKKPSTESPTTFGPQTPEPTTKKPSTEAPTTIVPRTPEPTTKQPSTEATTTIVPRTPEPTTKPPSTVTTTMVPETPEPTTKQPSTEATTTLGPQTPEPTTKQPSTEATTTLGPQTPEPTTKQPSTEATTTLGPQTPEPTTKQPSTEATTTLGPQTPEPTTKQPSTEATTTLGPWTPEPTTKQPSSEAATTFGPQTPDSTSKQSTEAPTRVQSSTISNQQTVLVSHSPFALENANSPEGLSSLFREPVEINNAPTKEVSETKEINNVDFRKSQKKRRLLKKKLRKNNISNEISYQKGKWAPAPSHQMSEPQYDAMLENDKRVWSMMMGPSKAQYNFNKLSREVAIADEPKQYCGGKDADVFFALDSSNSIWPEDFRKQIDFVTDLVDTFDFKNNKTRVGIIVYSTRIYMKVALQSGWTKEQIKRQLSNIEYVSGLTNTSDAIRFIRTYGFTEENARENAIKIAIILTDGISRDPIATKQESVLSRADGIKLFAIGIGTDIDKTELKRIANDPDDKYVFHVSSFAALASIRSTVAVSACGIVPDQPSNLLYCGADSLADVIFVYDAPGLGARKARLLTSFVHDVTRGLQTASGRLRIGRRSDNCPPNSNIDLTTDANLRAFSNIQFPGIETLLGQLRMAFPNRLDAKNLAVVFVDESTQNIELATRVLKGDLNFHVMVVAIGDMSLARLASDLATFPHNDYLMNIPSYMSLGSYRYEFLQKLCYLITNEPMYLRDARVRVSPDL